MDEEKHPVRILVLDRGFVMACRCPDPGDYGFWLPVYRSRTIRRWGTAQGLGELVNGPLAETVLDIMIPHETVPVRAVLRVIDAEETGWAAHLDGTAG